MKPTKKNVDSNRFMFVLCLFVASYECYIYRFREINKIINYNLIHKVSLNA